MSDPNFSAIRARLKYASLDAFVDGYSRFISSGGMFIPMAPEKLKPIGTTIRFQFLLNDGTTALLGEGAVLQVRPPDDSKPNAPVGMLVKFAKLSQESKKLVDRIVSDKESDAPEPKEEAAPSKDPTAAADDPTGEFSQEDLVRMAADEAAREAAMADDPPTREAPSAEDLFEDGEDEIALELERVDEEVRKEGGPRRLAGTDGGISVFAFDDMSEDDVKDFENFSFGGDEDDIDNMFDGLFGGGDDEGGGLFGGGGDGDGGMFGGDDDGGFFGDAPADDAGGFFDDAVAADASDNAAGDDAAAFFEGDDEVADEPVFDSAPEPEATPFEEVDAFGDVESEPELELAPADESMLANEDAFDDFDAPQTEIGRPASTVAPEPSEPEDDDDDIGLDFPEFDSAGPDDAAAEPEAEPVAAEAPERAYESFDEILDDDPVDEPEPEPESFFDDEFEDDEVDFPLGAEEEDDGEELVLDSSVSFVEEVIEEDDDDASGNEIAESGSGVYELIGSLDDDEEEELSLNLGHGSLAEQSSEAGVEDDGDEESLEALLASAQKEIESKKGDEEDDKPQGDIIDQLLGDDDDLPPPPPDMPAFQLPDGNSKKKRGGFISKLFGKD